MQRARWPLFLSGFEAGLRLDREKSQHQFAFVSSIKVSQCYSLLNVTIECSRIESV